jgi:hypothetical protein
LIEVVPSIGGSGASVKYSLEDYLDSSEIPGDFDLENSIGRIISEDDFPKFKINLKKNEFLVGETTISEGIVGEVQKYDSVNEYLTIKTKEKIPNNVSIFGRSSNSLALIKEVLEYETRYNIDSSSIIVQGWKDTIGFLNDNIQRIQDSDYYQLFSYSLKSEIEFKEWNSIVSNLNHTLGYKRFGDLIVEKTVTAEIDSNQNNGAVIATCDLTNITNIDAVYDYDLASENGVLIEENLTSDEITFNSVFLQDYAESIGNRVLLIDDISSQFSTSTTSKTTVTTFSI